MNPLNSYVKIRNIRDNEKRIAERNFQEAAHEFKTHANQLYDLLKKKEKIEENYKQSLENKSQLANLKSYHQYLTFLTPTILNEQKVVDKARTRMNKLQDLVTEQYIEVKKMDKLIENRKLQAKQIEKKQELSAMDEIAMRNYLQSKEG